MNNTIQEHLINTHNAKEDRSDEKQEKLFDLLHGLTSNLSILSIKVALLSCENNQSSTSRAMKEHVACPEIIIENPRKGTSVQYFCNECNYQTDLETKLHDHKRSHKENKEYKCHICDYKSKGHQHLINHMECHR